MSDTELEHRKHIAESAGKVIALWILVAIWLCSCSSSDGYNYGMTDKAVRKCDPAFYRQVTGTNKP